MKHNLNNPAADPEEETPGYNSYPSSEDIYNHLEKEEFRETEEEEPEPEAEDDKWNKIDEEREGDETGEEEDEMPRMNFGKDGLDIPGAELDDEQEELGSEDEENNYYSLGGDNHDDLDEREDIL